MAQGEISVIDGNSFVVSDDHGDIEAGTSHGIFSADTRFLSTYTLRIDGQKPMLLSSRNLDHHSASFYSTNRASEAMPQGWLSITRDRRINDGVHDAITIVNHGPDQTAIKLDIHFSADFADIFEVRGAERVKARTVQVEQRENSALAFQYVRPGFRREALATFSQPPTTIKDNHVYFTFDLKQQAVWKLDVAVALLIDGRAPSTVCELAPQENSPTPAWLRKQPVQSRDSWASNLPRLITNRKGLQLAYGRAIADLEALRLRTPTGDRIPAAGLPWYLALFGRDSIITALQTLTLGPELAIGTLRSLAFYQAERFDAFRDQQPGKIPHEIRLGELACLDELPHSRYYGTADATPLYLILLSEVYRWTGDLRLVRQLLPVAERALQWIDRYGDLDGDGYVEYQRSSERGLINQGWKDSTDCLSFQNGQLASAPIALAEVQGYVYDARLRMAELFAALGDGERAAALRRQAAQLKSQFNRDFWLPDDGYYALALDHDKRPVDAITSNPGHCLWSGIVDQAHAAAVVERLIADDMFSGWGVRTMSSRMANYNPISYHNGSVWPHDNSLIVAGLRRYGFDHAAALVAEGILAASEQFPLNRLPELFGGYPRRPGGFPVEYPGANAPQAWAAGAVISLLQTLLGLKPNGLELDLQPLPGVDGIELHGLVYQGQRIETLSAVAAHTEALEPIAAIRK